MTWRKSAGNKYGNKRVEVDGHKFASKKEANRYYLLRWRQDAGEISDLKLQPRYPLVVEGIKLGEYRADFSYIEVKGDLTIVEDVKGVQTPIFRWKSKHFNAQYGMAITLV